MPLGQLRIESLHRRRVEVDILAVLGRSFEPSGGVRLVDDLLRHRLHHDEVDVGDLVIAGADGIERAHAGRHVAVDMKPKLVRLGRRGSDPRRIHRRVEFRAPQACGLDLVDRRDRFGFRIDDQRALGGKRVLAVDDDRYLSVRGEQVARGAALVDAQSILDRRSGAAVIGHSGGDVLQQVPVVADVLVRIPQARENGLAGAVDHGRSGGRLDRSCGADGRDLAVGDQDRPVREILAGDGIEGEHMVDERRRSVCRAEKLVGDIAHHLRRGRVLQILELGREHFHPRRQGRDNSGLAEIAVVGIKPDGRRRKAKA